MSATDVIRAWKDPEYRATLGPQEQAMLPAHPAGLIELDDAALEGVSGLQPPGWDSLGSACYDCTAWGC